MARGPRGGEESACAAAAAAARGWEESSVRGSRRIPAWEKMTSRETARWALGDPSDGSRSKAPAKALQRPAVAQMCFKRAQHLQAVSWERSLMTTTTITTTTSRSTPELESRLCG